MTNDCRADRAFCKQHGVFYTPEPLARRVVQLALEQIDLASLTSLRVLDPAVGNGAFLLATLGCHPQLNLFGYEQDAQALQEARAAIIENPEQLVHADFLSLPPSPEFDLIIGNPPWVSFSGRHAQKAPSNVFGKGWRSLHSAFVEHSIQWLKPGGILAFLVPYSFCYQGGYGLVRAQMRQEGHIILIEQIGETAFSSVTEPAAILLWQRGVPEIIDDLTAPFRSPLKDELALNKAAIFSRRCDFSDFGVHSGNAAELIISDTPKWKDCALVREGRDIDAYHLNPPSKWVWTKPKLPEGRYVGIRSIEKYQSMPIVLRQTASRPVAAIHKEQTYFRNSILACGGLAGHAHSYIVALLNSPLMAYILRQSTPDVCQKTFPQVKVSDLKKLPIRDIYFRMSKKERLKELEKAKILVQEWIEQALNNSA
jgi:SAM-dependent methyltransferase